MALANLTSSFSLLLGKLPTSGGDGGGEFLETEPYEKEFSTHYDKHLRPRIEIFELARVAALHQLRLRSLWVIPPVTLFVITGGYFMSENIFFYLIIITILILAVTIVPGFETYQLYTK